MQKFKHACHHLHAICWLAATDGTCQVHALERGDKQPCKGFKHVFHHFRATAMWQVHAVKAVRVAMVKGRDAAM